MKLSFWKAIMGFFSQEKKKTSSGNNKKSNYIFYKIVEASDEENYILQCINTSVIIKSHISEITFDRRILSSLHPVQSCYIGIEYSKYLACHQESDKKELKLYAGSYLMRRYGVYQIVYEDRVGNLCFICEKTKREYLMDPRDIALSRELIEEFDAVQAFYIGYLAGLKLQNPIIKNKKTSLNGNPPYLKVVK